MQDEDAGRTRPAPGELGKSCVLSCCGEGGARGKLPREQEASQPFITPTALRRAAAGPRAGGLIYPQGTKAPCRADENRTPMCQLTLQELPGPGLPPAPPTRGCLSHPQAEVGLSRVPFSSYGRHSPSIDHQLMSYTFT